LIIKESDAHAWAEILVDGSWRRIETTAFAKTIAENTRRLLFDGGRGSKERTFLEKVDLYLMYAKYQVETWILHYSHFRQMQLLDEIKKSPAFLLKFLAGLLTIILLSIATVLYLRRPPCSDKLLCTMQPLIEALRKKGSERKEGETMHAFLTRCHGEQSSSYGIEMINHLYESIRYGGDISKKKEKELREAIRRCARELKR
jgi:hypothetical protein